MKNGGYKIIDLHDNNLTAVGTTIKGIYEAIENSYRKPLLLSGVVIDGVEKNDAFVVAEAGAGSYTITYGSKVITITSEDDVTVEDIEVQE